MNDVAPGVLDEVRAEDARKDRVRQPLVAPAALSRRRAAGRRQRPRL